MEDPEIGNLLCTLYGVPLPADSDDDCDTEYTSGTPRSGRGDIFDIFLTGTLYGQAEMAFNEALKRDSQNVDALVGQGILALARHDFEGALRWAEQARALNPDRAQILGVIVDAQVELGRYEEAMASAQAMDSLRPGLTSYSRISYLRELHG